MSIVNSLLKVFLGDKSGKDLKKLTPLVDEINKHFIRMSSLSNDCDWQTYEGMPSLTEVAVG